MSNTYTQIYIQIVFAVKGRQNLIPKSKKELLHRFITGIVKGRNQKLFAIHCMPDHVHILIGIRPTENISDLVRDIKAGSSGFINDKKWVVGKFQWQSGYGAFSYSHSQLNHVINYIDRQEEHHRNASFKDEYVMFLKKFNVEYDDKYLFDWIE
ncbi:MAG: IS200/IS605 family transposase [Bacteroidota bacterium]